MREVVLSMNVSIDGFVASVDGSLDWAYPNFDDALLSEARSALERTSTILMGRVDYELQSSTWPNDPGPIAALVNAAEKVVFSRTLAQTEWVNSRLATQSPEDEIADLKTLDGLDIGVSGGSRFAQYLSAQGLIDLYRLTIHPVALGAGMPLFGARTVLTPVDEVTLPTGVAVRTYRAN
jgi:dihydrofolate reductase